MGLFHRLFRRDAATEQTPPASQSRGTSRKRREFVLRSLHDLYPGQEGMRLTVADGVLEDVLAYAARELTSGATPHWHYVTRGLSDAKPSQGVELTIRVAADLTDDGVTPPMWPVELLNYLANYVADYGHPILPNHHVDLQKPFGNGADGHTEALTAAVFFSDPTLNSSAQAGGSVAFNQLIGVTERDLQDTLSWDPAKFIDLLTEAYPLGVTVPGRPSLRSEESFAVQLDEGAATDGSSTSHGVADYLKQNYTAGQLTLTLSPLVVESVLQAQRTRLAFGREFTLVGPASTVRFLPTKDTPRASVGPAGDGLVEVTRAVSDEILARLETSPGTYELTTVNATITVVDTDSGPAMT